MSDQPLLIRTPEQTNAPLVPIEPPPDLETLARPRPVGGAAVPELSKVRIGELYSLRTSCGLMLRMNVVSDATAEELRTLETQIKAELDRRPPGGRR